MSRTFKLSLMEELSTGIGVAILEGLQDVLNGNTVEFKGNLREAIDEMKSKTSKDRNEQLAFNHQKNRSIPAISSGVLIPIQPILRYQMSMHADCGDDHRHFRNLLLMGDNWLIPAIAGGTGELSEKAEINF